MSISFDNTKTKVGASFDIALTDEFMFFVWNGVSSRAYNCFIENKNDLTFTPHPSFTNNFETPLYQNTRYILGTTTEGKEIELNLCFYNITLEEFDKAISNWLQIGKTSLFQYEYEEWYGYNCRLKTVGNAKKYINTKINNDYLYIIEVSVSFETVEDSYALCKDFTILTDSFSISGGTVNRTNEEKLVSQNNMSSQEIIWEEGTGASANKQIVDGTNTFYIYYHIKNLGSLNCPFEISVSNINKGGSLIVLKNNSNSFSTDYTKGTNALLNIKSNPSAETSKLKYVYNSNTGLVSIGDQPANMVIVNSQEPLSYNKCLANQYFEPGECYLWFIIYNGDKIDNESFPIKISINFRKRRALI